jgi:hypothetical protein
MLAMSTGCTTGCAMSGAPPPLIACDMSLLSDGDGDGHGDVVAAPM